MHGAGLRFMIASKGAAKLITLLVLLLPGLALAQAPQPPLTNDDKAALLIESAHRAYNEQQYPVAAERYREYLKTYGGGKDVQAARYGLALCLVEGPQRDWKQVLENLAAPAADAAFPDRPFAVYYLGLAYRAQGHEALAQAAAKPPEAANFQNIARDQFTQALARFGEAADAFIVRAKTAPMIEGDTLSPNADWAVRCRCEQAEMMLRLDRAQEARTLLEPFVEKMALAKSRYRNTLLYYYGQACYALKDYLAAGRALSQLAPFNDPVHGVHAQYLLARTHHLAGERPEAQALYDAIQAGYEKQKAAAQQTLQNQPLMQNQPEEKARLEKLVNSPPEYVARARFYSGVMLYELQKFGDAQAAFVAFIKTYPQSPLVPEAQLRQGLSEVQLRQFQQAINTLNPLLGHAQLADRALLYSARATVGMADPKQPQQFGQTMGQMADRLRQAADRANQLIAQEPEAKLRRAECQLELGDTLQLAKDFAGAAATYTQSLQENHDPERTEELLQRLATALHFAGQFDPSDQVCQRYVTQYPRGALLGPVLFRAAENAFARAAAIEPTKPVALNSPAAKQYAEAITRAHLVIEKFPELPQLALARYHLGIAHYRLADYERALAEFKAIDGADRQGELAAASYYQADIILRTMPADANDALAAGRQVQMLTESAKLLESFAGGDAANPLVPDALLKLGVCYTQLGTLTADENERRAVFENAGKQFNAIWTKYGNHPVVARAIFEQAKMRLAMNDIGNAMNDLNRFRSDPHRNSEVAPLALVRLGSLLRSQNKAEEAVQMLTQARQQYEAALVADAAKQGWALLLQNQHGLALKQTGKLVDARAIFENAWQKFPALPDAYEAAYRAGQCRREDAMLKVEAARKTLARPDAKPEERAAAQAQIVELAKELAAAGQFLKDTAGQKIEQPETLQQLLYESAWCSRNLGEIEIEAARKQLFDAATQKATADLARRFPAPAKSPQARVPEIPLTAIAVQPGEQAARQLFHNAILTKQDSLTAQTARVELSELHALRGEYPQAVALLQEAFDAEPPPELEEHVRVRYGATLLAQGDAARALMQLTPVAAKEASPLMPEARYRMGECFIAQKDWAKAIERLQGFRDHGPLQNIPGLSDRALLRLGYAFAQAGQWDQSRVSYEQIPGRFGNNSPWRHEARYGMAWAFAQQKQHDPAVNTYQQVVAETAGEVAAKAQLQIGYCRAEQKRPEALGAFLAVADTYDYPEYAGPALLEAVKVVAASTKPEEAAGAGKILERVARDYPNTDWAKAALEQIAKLPKPPAAP